MYFKLAMHRKPQKNLQKSMLKNTLNFRAFGPYQANNYEKIENDKQLMRFNTLYLGGSYRHMWTYVSEYKRAPPQYRSNFIKISNNNPH